MGHPYISHIYSGGDYLLGGEIELLQKITYNDGLDQYVTTIHHPPPTIHHPPSNAHRAPTARCPSTSHRTTIHHS